MSIEENKAILRYLVEAFNRRDLTALDELFSPDFALHDANYPGWPRGLEGARKMFSQLLAIAPDIQATIEDVIAEADKVVIRWTFQSAKREAFSPSTAVAIGIYRIVNGKIAEDWGMAARSPTASPWE
jgi:predicted ester cyclase